MRSSVAVVMVVGSFVLWACSSPPPSAPDSDGRGNTAGGTNNGPSGTNPPSGNTTPAPAGSPAPAPSPGPGSGGAAGDGSDACYDACATNNPQGAQVMESLEATWKTCACQACATPCGQTFCSANEIEPADGDACSTCLGNATTCEQQWDTACNANPACVAISTCEEACEPPEADDDDGAGTREIPRTYTIVKSTRPLRVIHERR